MITAPEASGETPLDDNVARANHLNYFNTRFDDSATTADGPGIVTATTQAHPPPLSTNCAAINPTLPLPTCDIPPLDTTGHCLPVTQPHLYPHLCHQSEIQFRTPGQN